MKKTVIKIVYSFLFFIWFLLSLLPFRVLYAISDLLFFPFYYLIRYRRKIVRKNLTESFPEKEMKEIIRIEKDFFRYFCDYLFETIKLFTMSKKQMSKRMTFGGADALNEILKERDCILFLGHYCNWEWVSSIPQHLKPNVLPGQIYHKLENEAFDNLFLRMRSRFGAVNIEMLSALRNLVRFKKEGKRFIIGFISDQSPNWDYINLWTDFLNHKSAFFVGAENMAKKVDAAVFYLDMTRIKRGYYHAEFVLMTDRPKNFPDYDITVDYANRLERTIRRAPQFWLWSHNRWKRTYEEFQKRHK